MIAGSCFDLFDKLYNIPKSASNQILLTPSYRFSSSDVCESDIVGTYFHYSHNRLSNIIIQIAPCSMPPKQTQRSRTSRSQRTDVQLIAIADHLLSNSDPDPIPDLLKKMETAYTQHKQSLTLSLLHLLLKVCGVGGLEEKLDQADLTASLGGLLEAKAESKQYSSTLVTLIMSPRQEGHSEFIERLRMLARGLMGEDFPFLRQNSKNGMLTNLREWLTILAKSRMRSVRFSAVELAKIFIETEMEAATALITAKQPRKAAELTNDIRQYLLGVVKDRLKDVDSKLRDGLHALVRKVILNLEIEVVDSNTLSQLFAPLLADSSNRVTESALQTLQHITAKTKRLKDVLLEFGKENIAQLEYLSLFPSRIGQLSVKVLIELGKVQDNGSLLKPGHISRLFEYYLAGGYSGGLATLIEAFFCSIYAKEEQLLANRGLVVIEVMNLLNNLPQESQRSEILVQFLAYPKVECQKLFQIEEMFSVLLEQNYAHGDSQIPLQHKDLGTWLLIMQGYAQYVRQQIARFQALQSEKYDQERAKWYQIAQQFNRCLLDNIKVIFYERLRPGLTPLYLRLMAQIFLPIAPFHQSSLDFLLQQTVALFETDSDPAILRQVARVYRNVNPYDCVALIHCLPSERQGQTGTTALRKLAIINQFFVEKLLVPQELDAILGCFKKLQGESRTQLLVGCLCFHNWAFHNFIHNYSPAHTLPFHNYLTIQQTLIRFFFDLLHATDGELRLCVLDILCQILSIASSDALRSSDLNASYQLTEQNYQTFFRVLNTEVGLPTPDLEASFGLQITRLNHSFGFSMSMGTSTSKDNLIRKLFNLFENSSAIAWHPIGLQTIAGALFCEEDQTDGGDLTVSKQNASITGQGRGGQTLYSREKLASKYIGKLVEAEIAANMADSFVFWLFIQKLGEELINKTRAREKVVGMAIGIYVRARLNKAAQKVALNKAMLFILSEVDRLFEIGAYELLSNVTLILKKLNKRIVKEALYRVYLFVKNKEAAAQVEVKTHAEVKALMAYLQKTTRSAKKEQEESDPEQEEKDEPEDQGQGQGDDGVDNERAMMQPRREGRQTRSMQKKEQESSDEEDQ